MIDLTKITPDEANKIECALLCLEKEIIGNAEAYEDASTWEDLPEKSRNVMKSNGEWWREIHALLFESKRR
jgi:hypothetical protein